MSVDSEVPAAAAPRMATAAFLLEKTVPLYLAPVPSEESFKQLLKRNRVPFMKANPCAKRGGGHVYFSVAHVEKLLRRQFGG